MPGRFTVTTVADPALIGQVVWENLPTREQELDHERQFSSWEWGAFDQRRFRIEPESYRTESLARIAAEYGFSNPSRFAQLFRRTYGAYPSEALHARRGRRVEQR